MRQDDVEPQSNAAALIASARYFTELPEELAIELCNGARRVVVRKGAFVHQKGDAASGMYRLVSGSIRVSTTNSEGRETVLTDLTAGAFFGEISVFDDLPRTHDARAIERSEILLVSTQRLHELLEEHPAYATHFLRALSAKLRLCFAVIEGMGMQSLQQRLASRLLWLAEQRAPTLEVPLALGVVAQSDLAAMVGATRQSVNKELQALQRAGVIQLSNGCLTLHDIEHLKRVADL